MYARLATYHLRVSDLHAWIGDLERLMAAPDEDPPAVGMLAELEGCRGAWFLVHADEQTYEESIADARERLQRGETSLPDEVEQMILSFWDTREQADTVRERLGDRLGQLLGSVGVTLARPPETTTLRIEGGRVLQPTG